MIWFLSVLGGLLLAVLILLVLMTTLPPRSQRASERQTVLAWLLIVMSWPLSIVLVHSLILIAVGDPR